MGKLGIGWDWGRLSTATLTATPPDAGTLTSAGMDEAPSVQTLPDVRGREAQSL